MDMATLFNKVSVLLDDLKYNSNNDNSDQIYSDDDKIGVLNMVMSEFNFETGYNRFSNESTEYQITTIIGQDLYNLPSGTSRIYDIFDDNKKLKERSYSSVTDTFDFSFDPQVYYLDYIVGKVKFYPIPRKSQILKVRGTFKNRFMTLNDLNLELPFPQEYHEYFKYGMAVHLLQKTDIDAQDLKLADNYDIKWKEFCRRVRLEIIRLSGTIITYDNNPYNAW